MLVGRIRLPCRSDRSSKSTEGTSSSLETDERTNERTAMNDIFPFRSMSRLVHIRMKPTLKLEEGEQENELSRGVSLDRFHSYNLH